MEPIIIIIDDRPAPLYVGCSSHHSRSWGICGHLAQTRASTNAGPSAGTDPGLAVARSNEGMVLDEGPVAPLSRTTRLGGRRCAPPRDSPSDPQRRRVVAPADGETAVTARALIGPGATAPVPPPLEGAIMDCAGPIIHNPVSGERIEFRRTAADTHGELLEIELALAAEGNVPGAHVHPEQQSASKSSRAPCGSGSVCARSSRRLATPYRACRPRAQVRQRRRRLAGARVQITPRSSRPPRSSRTGATCGPPGCPGRRAWRSSSGASAREVRAPVPTGACRARVDGLARGLGAPATRRSQREPHPVAQGPAGHTGRPHRDRL